MLDDDQTFAIDGFRVGHWTHPDGVTGCTVILAEQPSPAVADVRGGAPGTREIALLDQGRLVQRVDAVLLSGGSAFGLAAADGVVQWLRERGRGFPTSSIPVPIVPAAVIYDLHGASPLWPDSAAGYAAAEAAMPNGWVSGPVGAGAGATVGKLLGRAGATRSGIGSALEHTPAGSVAALFVVNAFGDVVDPESGGIIAGCRSPMSGGDWVNVERAVLDGQGDVTGGLATNTVIGVVVVDAAVDRDALVRVAVAAHDGLARSIRPAHTVYDGDTIFAIARAEGPTTPRQVVQLATGAQRCVSRAVVRSVRQV